MGLVGSIRNALRRTSNALGKSIAKDKIVIEELERTLIEADFGVQITMDIIETVKKSPDKKTAIEEIKKYLLEILELPEKSEITETKPYVVMFVGVNGVGKTTAIAKMANMELEKDKNVSLVAGDTFRAAAIEQLTIWSERLKIPIFKGEYGADPASIAYKAISESKGEDRVILIDTAGRLHTNKNLMGEMEKIVRVARKIDERYPNETFIVLDASIGQNNIKQAKQFMEYAPLTGIVLTKLDGTAKGGSIFPIIRDLRIPVKYIGTGEGLEDISQFNGEEFLNNLFPD
ncbi:MAG: signal recognition particle-docking protein FtsY [Proteobacteria bacterium]|nr:signal recognition particle-docking protein FtsY [Pseudomonadota bacterium]